MISFARISAYGSCLYTSFRLFVLQFGCCLILCSSISQVIGWLGRLCKISYNVSSGTSIPTLSICLVVPWKQYVIILLLRAVFNYEGARQGWRPVSQWWAQRSQQKPTINCAVSPCWLCCRQRSQRKKSRFLEIAVYRPVTQRPFLPSTESRRGEAGCHQDARLTCLACLCCVTGSGPTVIVLCITCLMTLWYCLYGSHMCGNGTCV